MTLSEGWRDDASVSESSTLNAVFALTAPETSGFCSVSQTCQSALVFPFLGF